MGRRCHGTGLGPGEQFMGGNETFAELQVFLAVVGYAPHSYRAKPGLSRYGTDQAVTGPEPHAPV
jgi:hypothetical protein